MAKVKITLRKHDGSQPQGYPLTWYINYLGRPYYRRTGYFCQEAHWNPRQQFIRQAHPQYHLLKSYLIQQQAQLQMDLTQREARGEPFKMAWDRTTGTPETFSSFFQEMIQMQIQSGSLGNAEVYARELKWLRIWMDQDDIPFSAIDYLTMRKLVAWCDGQGYSFHTISHKIRTLKAVWNSARQQYPDQASGDPFRQLLAGRKARRTEGREISHQSAANLKKLWEYHPANKSQQRALDVFWMALFLRGAGIIDVLYLGRDNRREDRIHYRRLKMPQREVWLDVGIHPEIERIWQRYDQGQRYLFDLVKVPRSDARILRGKVPEGSRQYQNARSSIDTILKRISRKLQLVPDLSMIQARHCWVLLARDLGIPKEVIQQSIGHQGTSVMDRHYFGQYEKEYLDQVNAQVIGAITLSGDASADRPAG